MKKQLLLLFWHTSLVGGLSFEYIPTDTLRTYEYPYDGSGNNIQNEMYGLSNQPRVRIVPNRSGYFNNDGRTPRNEQTSGLPSARRVMEEIFRYDESEPSLPTFSASPRRMTPKVSGVRTDAGRFSGRSAALGCPHRAIDSNNGA